MAPALLCAHFCPWSPALWSERVHIFSSVWASPCTSASAHGFKSYVIVRERCLWFFPLFGWWRIKFLLFYLQDEGLIDSLPEVLHF
uniref:La ribonucleoprotein domain family, member 5 n=1 Tax=Pan troglodytes TaxID=9598 RepID=G2HJU2_PANTR|nr:la ribonucleoprotein domain family, member 5 [Pan troglodytes]